MSETKPAPICYLEIPAPSIEKAGSFYRSVFAWKIQPSSLTNQQYWMFETGEGSLMGGLDTTKAVQEGGIIFYIKVEDIAAMLKAIDQAGGSMVAAKEDIGGGYGFSAVFKDPNGNRIGLWSKS